jgi:hypothetical protein
MTASNLIPIFPHRTPDYSRAVRFIAEVIRLHQQGIQWPAMSRKLAESGFSLELARRAERYWMMDSTILADAKAFYEKQHQGAGVAFALTHSQPREGVDHHA